MGDEALAPRDVAVVIVNWNAGDALRQCVASLRDHADGAEVIVVDNASSDGSVEAARREHPGLRLVANERNRGLAAGNNQGIGASTRPLVLISNPDVVYTPGAVASLVDVMDRRPRAAFVIARPERPDGTRQTAAGDLPTLGEALLGRQVARSRGNVDTGFWWDGWAHDEERCIGRGLEASYLVRRAAIDEVGPQDERFRLDWEGIDWTERMRAAGWEVWFCPSARVVHLGGASIRKVQVRWVVRQHVGMYRYFAKRRSVVARPVLAVLFTLRAAVKALGLAVGLSRYERSHRD
ncbi:MAG: glycosyltransferase family 2 protein [Acidimicrobiales bacterium]